MALDLVDARPFFGDPSCTSTSFSSAAWRLLLRLYLSLSSLADEIRERGRVEAIAESRTAVCRTAPVTLRLHAGSAGATMITGPLTLPRPTGGRESEKRCMSERFLCPFGATLPGRWSDPHVRRSARAESLPTLEPALANIIVVLDITMKAENAADALPAGATRPGQVRRCGISP